jgi:hypothetical protein
MQREFLDPTTPHTNPTPTREVSHHQLAIFQKKSMLFNQIEIVVY